MEDNCIFCKIILGKIPAHKVYEDDNYLGFMDIRPLAQGNTLLIPKQHYRWTSDVPEFGKYFEIAKKIGLATLPLVKANYVSFLTLGMEVPHAHIRIIPRFIDKDPHTHGIDTNLIIQTTPEELKSLAHEINQSLSS